MEYLLLACLQSSCPRTIPDMAGELGINPHKISDGLSRLCTRGSVKQHGWDGHGAACFWLPQALEDQLWAEAEGADQRILTNG